MELKYQPIYPLISSSSEHVVVILSKSLPRWVTAVRDYMQVI